MLTPMQIDNRINGFLGKPAGSGRRPAVIHLHERYGIVQHTTDLGQKFVDAGYVTIVPDLFSRFTGDRQALPCRRWMQVRSRCQGSARPAVNRCSYQRNEIISRLPSSCTARFTRTIGSLTRSARNPSINY